MIAGYGWSGVNGEIGIQTSGVVGSTISGIVSTLLGNNNEGNTVSNTGYIGIRYDGDTITVEENFVENVLLVLDDGGCLYTWGESSKNHIVRKNVVGHAVGSKI